MGYRSQGEIVIKGPELVMVPHLTMLRMTQTNPDPWKPRKESSVRIYRDGEDVVWHLQFDDWKWHTDYPDVAECERIWDESQDIEGLSGGRWRIGEEDNDIEANHFGEEWIDTYIERSGSTDFSAKFDDVETFPSLGS